MDIIPMTRLLHDSSQGYTRLHSPLAATRSLQQAPSLRPAVMRNLPGCAAGEGAVRGVRKRWGAIGGGSSITEASDYAILHHIDQCGVGGAA